MNPSRSTVRRFTPGDLVRDNHLNQLGRVSHYGSNGEPQVVSLEHGHQTSMPEHVLTLVCVAAEAPEHARLIDADDVQLGMILLRSGEAKRVVRVSPRNERLYGVDIWVSDGKSVPLGFGFEFDSQVAVATNADGSSRCWCGYEPAGSTEASRLQRWEAACKRLEVAGGSDLAGYEEQAAWDAMAEHDDPEYVRSLEADR